MNPPGPTTAYEVLVEFTVTAIEPDFMYRGACTTLEERELHRYFDGDQTSGT